MARRKVLVAGGPASLTRRFPFRLLLGGLVLGVVIFLALAGVGGVLTYHVITANNAEEAVNPQSYLLSSFTSLNFTDRSGGEHEGWLLFGLRGAPAIILCHGYNSNRSDLLWLGSILRDNHFNVYLFNFQGPKAGESRSDLGPRQASDLLSAIEIVVRQSRVNPNRVGLFGASVGGYASLVAAESNPKVRALVVDSAYTSPEKMFDSQIESLLGGSSGIFHGLTDAEFHIASLGGDTYPMTANLSKLVDIPKLFISGRDNPPLAAMTETLYTQVPQPKRLLVMEHSGSSLTSEAERKEYENQVLNFFLQNLSLSAN